MLDFEGEAIILSGVTGTKLKSEIIGSYYQTWWQITSGGKNQGHDQQTAIIEMNAATGEIYIEETKETELGSAGHALDLKGSNPNSTKLNVILVEEHSKCFSNLQKVIKRRWPHINYSLYPPSLDKDWVYLFTEPNQVIEVLDKYNIGISLFFFDPLLYTPWSEVEEIAKRRIKKYYQIGTEFLIFIFTSDWFTGRGELHSLPNHHDEKRWTKGEFVAVRRCNQLFGNSLWQSHLLYDGSLESKMQIMTKLYKRRLQKWFRYVLPMPFEPNPGQTYHIFVCSNYEAGTSITRQFYTKFTGNSLYFPDNTKIFQAFLKEHPEKKMKKGRADEWKILWNVIRNHQDGLCDIYCRELIEKQTDVKLRVNSLEWLEKNKYLKEIKPLSKVWSNPPKMYQLNWKTLKDRFNIQIPRELIPLRSRV